ncbi:MAG: hypothetical protein O3B95_04330 [Chloroflexi bacterium]|nr:hypothetical protein [Chloroflexota bacterium]
MPNLGQLLATKTSADNRRIFELCREISTRIDDIQGVYVVGGAVRDLILDRKPDDVDISVVGNAAAFSELLAVRLGANAPTTSQFLTYRIELASGPIDIVTARSESYATPAALPDVAPSSIVDDLKRRDFTVNAMGISLLATNWGNLVDPANGFGDIMRKRIRVLHDASFVDDPTRMYRAVRYAARLGFSLEPHTHELLAQSLGNVERVSGARLRHEFELILAEPTRVEVLRMAEEFGLLGAISPGLRIGTKALEILGRTSPENIEDMLAVVTFGLNAGEADQVAVRFDGPAAWNESITGGPRLASLVSVLDQEKLQRSEVADILSPIPLPAIRAYIAVGPPLPRRNRMIAYMDKIRFEKPEITGDDLIAAGIPESPVIGKLIELVKRAKLDGQVHSREEELKLAKSRLPGFLIAPKQ